VECLRFLAVMALVSLAITSFGKDHPDYQVGVFVGKDVKDDGSLVSTNGGYSKGVQQGHYTYTVRTDDGSYVIESPTAVASSIFASLATNGQSANIHKDSFLDTLHEGDKVLFSGKCDKHRRCSIKMPNPDDPKKTINTVGWFWPARGKSNVTALCGSGKLSQTIESEYCVKTPSRTAGSNVDVQPINAATPDPASTIPVPAATPGEPTPTLPSDGASDRTTAPVRESDIRTKDATTMTERPASEVTAEISSDPLGADIDIDGAFVGSTPSSVGISAGEHTLTVSKNGYKPWARVLQDSTGNIQVIAALEPIPPAGAVSELLSGADSSLGAQSLSTRTPAKVTSSVPDRQFPASSAAAPGGETVIGVWFAGKPTVRHDGIQIAGVEPGGPADSIDMKPGDWILAIDGHFLYTIDELRAELRRHKIGARLQVQYRRDHLVYENSIIFASNKQAQ
jgi:hypothetical protein